MNRSFYFIVFLCLTVNSCSNYTEIPSHLNNSVLYVEDTDGVGGLWAGNFGDIVVFDLEQKSKFILTDDRYFDENPSFSKSQNRVFFESLRDYQTSTGLTSQNNIYFLDLKNKQIKQFDDETFTQKYQGIIAKHNKMPAISKNGEKLAFLTKTPGKSILNNLVIYDFSKDTIITIAEKLFSCINITWVDSNNLIYSCKGRGPLEQQARSYITKINLISYESSIIIYSKNAVLEQNDNLDSTLIYTSYFHETRSKNKLNVININNNRGLYSVNTNELGFEDIKSPLFMDKKNIIFIGNENKVKGDLKEDLYILNMEDNSIKQITYDGNLKHSLSH